MSFEGAQNNIALPWNPFEKSSIDVLDIRKISEMQWCNRNNEQVLVNMQISEWRLKVCSLNCKMYNFRRRLFETTIVEIFLNGNNYKRIVFLVHMLSTV